MYPGWIPLRPPDQACRVTIFFHYFNKHWKKTFCNGPGIMPLTEKRQGRRAAPSCAAQQRRNCGDVFRGSRVICSARYCAGGDIAARCPCLKIKLRQRQELSHLDTFMLRLHFHCRLKELNERPA